MSQFCEKRVQKPSILKNFHDIRKSGSGRCSISSSTCKIIKIRNSKKNLGKLFQGLSFGMGFIKIHKLLQILQKFEVPKIRFSDILPHFLKEMRQNI